MIGTTKTHGAGRWRPRRDLLRGRPRAEPVDEPAWIMTAHREVEKRVRKRLVLGRPLRVVFAVNERAKWVGDELVAEMQRRGWEVSVILYMMPWKEGHRREYEQDCEFFASVPATFMDGWDFERERRRRIEEFEADIVFLEQPWGMKDFPKRLLGQALTVYADYGIFLMEYDGQETAMPSFHPYLWRHFTPTELHRRLHLSIDPSAAARLRVVGHPQLDRYLAPQPYPAEMWEHPTEPTARVVVAPHHSIGPTTMKLSTFRWSHRVLLEMVERHPEMAFVYKPHPRTRHAVITDGVMTANEYDAYVERWRAPSNSTMYEGPRYIDLFRTSDALVTDSVSFLAEYLPTGKPILRLVRADSIGFNEIGERLTGSFYAVGDDIALEQTVWRVVSQGIDPLMAERTESAALLGTEKSPAAHKLIDEIVRSIYTAR